MTINLRVEKGTRTWLAIVDESLTPKEFVNESGFAKGLKGILSFSIQKEGIYKSNDAYGTKFHLVSKCEVKEITKKLAKEYFVNQKEFTFAPIPISFCLITTGPNNTSWISDFTTIDENSEIAEDENFYYINGEFKVERKKYHRNFQKLAGSSTKEIILKHERFDKKRDNIKIINAKTKELIYINPEYAVYI